ncbi:hypothetical protein IU459_22145 [Nocardia amamiensis]|uniref:Lipoprotein n=1 Tax=Nocardia amamiensis TaxID=404578 RepID=A0ABS0CUL5_9NOCA|nr:hypothetical protein [Nocardia amamiensis]MBF6300225.1 hypothetical protein [Nocardia amamiensis]
MLGTVAAVVWLARPSAPACGASHEAASTSRLPVVAVTFAPVVSGEARRYELGWPVSCSLRDFPADGAHAGVSTADDGRADQCAAYLDLEAGHAPALVLGSCSECTGEQQDPNAATFVPVAGSSDGVVRVRYRLVRGSQPAPDLTYEVAPDSSASWFAVLFGDAENGAR